MTRLTRLVTALAPGSPAVSRPLHPPRRPNPLHLERLDDRCLPGAGPLTAGPDVLPRQGGGDADAVRPSEAGAVAAGPAAQPAGPGLVPSGFGNRHPT